MWFIKSLMANIAGNLIWLTLALVGGAIVAYLRVNQSTLVDPALYGLGAFALILLTGCLWRWMYSIQRQIEAKIPPPRTSAELSEIGSTRPVSK